MRCRSIITAVLFMGILIHTQDVRSQAYLTSSANMPRVGDNICRRQIQYFSPGNTGEEQVWDFRDLELMDESHTLTFFCDSDSLTLYASSPWIMQKFRISGDTLQALGYETSLKFLTYNPSINLLVYPCAFGDRICQPYKGEGSYCEKYELEATGTMESEADATGTIYFNDTDTLFNVIRVHQISSAGIRQHLPEDSVPDETNIKQRIEERYYWHARGYRYPVFETNSITIYNDMEPVSCQQTAFCTLPSDQFLPEDSINQQILLNDSLERINAELLPVIHYTVTMDGNYVTVNYSLDADATINAILCDRMGLVYRRESAYGLAESQGAIRINTNGLKSGIYILYLNVNGQVFNEKIDL